MTEESYPTINDVLNNFVTEFEQPTREAIELWIGKYPQFEHQIVDFAATWIEQEILPPSSGLSSEMEQSLVERAMSHAQNILFEQEKAAISTTETSPVVSLLKEAKQLGIGVEQLLQECNLDKPLLSKLDKLMICPETIPQNLIQQFARILHRPYDAIANYFRRPSSLQSNNSFLSKGKPELQGQQSFTDAVRRSTLSPERKAKWLIEFNILDAAD
jgi:hypothetical protein